MRQFSTDIRNEDGDPIRFKMFHTPGSSDADCAHHYRDKLKARGDVFEQVREAEKAYGNFEDMEKDVQYAAEQKPHGKLPGLISSQKGAYLDYHGVMYVYKDPLWKHKDGEQSVEVVEFDPALMADDYYLSEMEMRAMEASLT